MRKLQNGSDIRGVAMATADGTAVNLDKKAAMALGKAFTAWLSEKTGLAPSAIRISIGMDPRLSGPDLFDGLAAGIGSMGALVLNCGLASTPAMFMSTVFPSLSCDGAIMITASHLPMNRNGFKFFSKGGGLNKGDIAHIIEKAMNPSACNGTVPCETAEPSAPTDTDLMSLYAAHLRNLIQEGVSGHSDKPLSGLKIMVDCGNGAGGFYAENVLKPLGADISPSQFLEPDGNFPNHAPNPEDKDALASAAQKTKASGADLGIIFDTDVDRSAAIDKGGKVIARDGIVALAAALIAPDFPGTTVVTDSVTGSELKDFLENQLAMKHLRFKRGYRNVINKAIELNASGEECHLAIETSGHGAYKENYFLDDGAYLATKIIIAAAKLNAQGKTIGELIKDLKLPAETREVRMNINCDDFASYGEEILNALKDAVANKKAPFERAFLDEPNYEGVRINFRFQNPGEVGSATGDSGGDGEDSSATGDSGGDIHKSGNRNMDAPDACSEGVAGTGWCLLRMSLHDPLLALNMEASVEGGTAVIADAMREFLRPYTSLDTDNL